MFALIVLTSCGDAATSSSSDEDAGSTIPGTTAIAKTAVDGPVMRYPTPSSSVVGMAAEVRGVLQLEGSCLYISLDEIAERYPVLWPAGTWWDAANQSVVPPTGAPMPIGSTVYGGGGYMHVSEIERLAGQDAAALASTCVDNQYGEVAVVNNQDTAISLSRG